MGRSCHPASFHSASSSSVYACLLHPLSDMQCCCTGALAHLRCQIHSPSFSLCPVSVQEEQNRGKPNWEHLNEDLHVLITVEDTQNRAEIKMRRAVEEVKKLLVPAVST